MEHLKIIENLLYGAMESSNEMLDEMFLITACGKAKQQDGETYDDAFNRYCDEIREECRKMWESIAFYHTHIFLGSNVQGETIYDEL